MGSVMADDPDATYAEPVVWGCSGLLRFRPLHSGLRCWWVPSRWLFSLSNT